MKAKRTFVVLCLWVAIWFAIDKIISNFVLFVGPYEVIKRLLDDMKTAEFWISIYNTYSGIAAGFFTALFIGTILAYVSYYHEGFEIAMSPLLDFFRYIPMISFTLLAIYWGSKSLIVFEVSVFLSLPVIYRHALMALKDSGDRLLTKVWTYKKISFFKKIDLIYRPALMPEYMVGCHRALNMCCKSGIIAQFIGNGEHSIAKCLANAGKSHDLIGLFSWTIVIVMLSILLEKTVIAILSLPIINETKRVDKENLRKIISEDEDIYL